MRTPDKLLLVSANRHKDPYPVYPLGISYIKTSLEQKKPELKIRVFDFMTGTMEEYTRILHEFNPDFTGISLRNIDDVNIYKQESFIDFYKEIITHTRHNSSSIIITGGSGFSIYPKLLFEKLTPDFGIYGEGETGLLDLINALENKSDFRNINGLVFRNGDTITANKRGCYLNTPGLVFEDQMIDYYWATSGMMNIQTKRGCPFNCIYCTYPLIEGKQIRTLSIKEITNTLHDLYFNRKIDYVFFTDSIFNTDNDFNMELADSLIKEKIKIKWGAYFNFVNVNRKLLIVLKQAGLTHIEFGTESLSAQMLKNYHKPFSLDDIFNVSEICNELEIDFAHFLILGGYGETNNTLDETFENSKKIKRTVFFPFMGMRIYPGTRLHQIAIDEGIIQETNDLLKPVYYLSSRINVSEIKEKALKTGRPWIFPDDDLSVVMDRMRKRNKKGPLWEYLVK